MSANWKVITKKTLVITGAVIGFLFAIHLIGFGFKSVGSNITNSIDLATSNPFIGLFIGLLLTAILQSSSTVTTLAVAAVASGSLSLQQTIPIILGANIGTTLTSTIVSLSYITNMEEFRKALSAGSVHDFYNILVVLIMFPLELQYGLLSSLSTSIVLWFGVSGSSGSGFWDFISLFDPIANYVVNLAGSLLTLILAFVLLFITIKAISRMLYQELIGKRQERFEQILFRNKYQSFGAGLLITSIVQSSSLVTSLTVPLVATGKIQLRRSFEFIIGANLGTTITAIIAAMTQSEAALSLAAAHFLLNLFGGILFLNIPFLTRIPVYFADKLGQYTVNNRIIGFIYILITFFVIPFTLIYLSR